MRLIDADKIPWRYRRKLGLGIDFGLNEPDHYYIVVKDEVDVMPTVEAIPVEYIKTFIMNEIKNRDKHCKGSSSWDFANERALILQSLIDVWLERKIEE